MKQLWMSEQLWMPEQVKWIWESIKTAPAIAALMFLFFQQPANAKWLNAQNEEFCSTTKNTTITCEWWIAYTSQIRMGKSVKYDRTWKPQKCKCISKTEKWILSDDTKTSIMLDDGLWDNKNTTKE